jgi:hypothetical protein
MDAAHLENRSVYVPEHIIWHDGGVDLVVFNGLNGTYHAFDGVGSDIWRALARDGRLSTAASELRQRYEDDAGAIDGDLRAFVDHALSLGLLEPSSEQ